MLSDDGKAILTEHGDESEGCLAKDDVTKDEDEDEAGFKGDSDGTKARSLVVRFIIDERIELAITVCLCFLSCKLQRKQVGRSRRSSVLVF